MAHCAVCKDFSMPVQSAQGRISNGTKEDLSASSEKCVSCSILWEALREFEPLHGRIHSTWNLRQRLGILGISYDVIVDEKGTGSKWSRVIELFVTTRDPISRWPAVSVAKDITDVSEEEKLVELKRGLERCNSEHKTCPKQSISQLPTRVIDVSGGIIRLVDTRYQRGNYITLSHCWGAYQPLRTLQVNIEEHMVGIRLGNLPKTFRDAVRVTRYLGIKYLWIDSLCIIQDSAEDWQKESALMASIYGDSFLTLLATASKDGRGGLFTAKDGMKRKIEIHRTLSEGQKVTIHARAALAHEPYSRFKLNLGDPDLPLLERSWCFQEYLLSPRIAHFNEDEIVWNCGSSQGCNCESMLRVPGGRESLKGQILDARTNPTQQIERVYCQAGTRLHTIWWNLVDVYSTKLLTFEGDRLPALSGIAKYMQRQTRDTYLAGLWQSQLADDLFWRAMPNTNLKGDVLTRTPPFRPKEYRAPSWSWVSVNARIGHIGKNNTGPDRCMILESECQPAGLDPTGSVKSGHLLIRGILTEAESWLDEGEPWLDESEDRNKLKLTSPEAEDLPELVWQADVRSEANNDLAEPSSVCVLWWTFESQENARGLVLRSFGQSGTFKRLGTLDTDEVYTQETYEWPKIQEFLEGVDPSLIKIF